jgi:hypothetical protein
MPDTHSALTRPEFESAIRAALRHYVRSDLLAENPLMRSRLLGKGDPRAPGPLALKTLLADTAEGLFANARDTRFYRVLYLMYFNPAPKQKAVAQQLGLSFGTYRRYLATATDRLTGWLWQQEQAAGQRQTPDPSVVVSPPRLSVVILPFLNLSREPSVDYLVDGIVDSLITDLSPWLPASSVISRSTAFTYKGRSVPLRQVGAELGVRYVLEGSVSVDPVVFGSTSSCSTPKRASISGPSALTKRAVSCCRCKTRLLPACRAAWGSRWCSAKPRGAGHNTTGTRSTW